MLLVPETINLRNAEKTGPMFSKEELLTPFIESGFECITANAYMRGRINVTDWSCMQIYEHSYVVARSFFFSLANDGLSPEELRIDF